jgi:hypothetical protein
MTICPEFKSNCDGFGGYITAEMIRLRRWGGESTPRVPQLRQDGKGGTRSSAIPVVCVGVEWSSCAAWSDRSLGRPERHCRHAGRICALLLAKDLRVHVATSRHALTHTIRGRNISAMLHLTHGRRSLLCSISAMCCNLPTRPWRRWDIDCGSVTAATAFLLCSWSLRISVASPKYHSVASF